MHKFLESAEHLGDRMGEAFHVFGLFIIGIAIVWATAVELLAIFAHGGPSIKDILLLFIYLELAAMVGIYFKTKHLPVRFLVYIAITALTRVLAIDIKEMSDLHMLSLTGSILALCVAVLVLRFASSSFPSKEGSDS
jgi:phosphate starvation-inducible membrane PsiE